MEPGRQLLLEVQLLEHTPTESRFKGEGRVDGQELVGGKFTLTRYNLRDRDPKLHDIDRLIVETLRDQYQTLRKGSVGAKAMVRIPTTVAQSAATN
jgi:3-hydroxyacyl-[acyl-carrier-protein] dehydratase